MGNTTLQQNDKGLYAFNQDNNVLMQKNSGYLGILDRDWRRLERAVNRCQMPNVKFANIAYCLFGVAGSALITWLTVFFSNDTESWIKWIIFLALIVCVFLGIICLHFHGKEIAHYEGDISIVKDEISDINQALGNNEDVHN